MASSLLKSQLTRFWRARRSSSVKGFTLIELLVVTLVAGGIISGLMYLVVELLTADQRESALSETQRDMQRSLEYMSTELREAVYVYPGGCLTTGTGTLDPNDDADPTKVYCPGLANFIPSLTNSGRIPVLAFWKQQRLPDPVLAQCRSATPPADTPCLSGHSYSLIVYSLTTERGTANWQGKARIIRYALTQFNRSGGRNADYANPVSDSTSFSTWPLRDGIDQRSGSAPSSNIAPLTDFVDDGTGATRAGVTAGTCPDDTSTPIPEYSVSPPTGANRTFYACVSYPTEGANQDVLLFVRGNAEGRAGVRLSDPLPTLSTQVLARGVLNKQPQ
jgi:prepilin-type N-terminal cleavage/methylation domain-containing protein